MSNFKVGQKVNYANGNEATYTGEIVAIAPNGITVVSEEGKALWDAGFAVGSFIQPSQIKAL